MKTTLFSACLLITSLAATMSARDVTTKEPSDKYGPGGTHETTSDEKYQVIKEVYYDKCGRKREAFWAGPGVPVRVYFDENGKRTLTVTNGNQYFAPEVGVKRLDPAEGKALVEKLEKTPSAPCPEKTATAPESPEKPKEQPHPKAKPELPGGAFSPSLTPLAEPQTFNWTGPYMGIQFGFNRISSDYSRKDGGLWNDFPDVRNEIEFRGMHEFDQNGFGLGGCAGYNYQFNNNVVIGVGVAGRKFWGLDAMHDTGDFPADMAGNFDVWSSFNTTGIVTFGPKAGYACGRFLPYVSGGLAFGELDASQKLFSSTFGIHEIGKQSENRLGWNVAGGLQYAVTKNWSLRMEYSYSDLGTFKYAGRSSDTFHDFTTWHMATLTEHGGNFGIVYNFSQFGQR